MTLPFDPVAEAQRHWTESGWAEQADGMAAVTSIMRAQQIVQGRVDSALRPMGLTFARYEVLMLLQFSQEGTLPMSLIGERLQVHPTSVTNAVDRLERARHVARERHPSDRRAVIVQLLDHGRTAAAEATESLNQQVFSRMGISDDQVEALVGALADLRRNEGDF